MRLLSNADISQLEASAKFFELKESYHKLHTNGLSKLIDIDKISNEEVLLMINNIEPLTRKYGIIAAKRLYNRFPTLINDAMKNHDNDISKFAQEVIKIFSD